MNLIAIIGIIHSVNKMNKDVTNILLRVKKPFFNYGENSIDYECIPIEINNLIFKNELENIIIGNLIGLKGRLENDNNTTKVIAEKIQLF